MIAVSAIGQRWAGLGGDGAIRREIMLSKILDRCSICSRYLTVRDRSMPIPHVCCHCKGVKDAT